ncbi:hypothetical protein AJ80_02731 [Polytolypa hystricis UAMH7299]|uniref:Uncharacterized protein n=1 Tax=Polytolypa hystricis (strain UAMH7299) TaxID=1447883 RepID=A0A2B7YQ74_POLH7|nr:hypothetical protein AJ80_02731 [Polytolypa hystricis UAMH7299]
MNTKAENGEKELAFRCGVQLNGTSQGSSFDCPPDHWIEDELIRFGVRNLRKPNLEDVLHPLFQPRCWPELGPYSARWLALKPSFLLATKLLKVAGPFTTSILREPNLVQLTKRIEINESPTAEELELAFAELEQIALHVEWRENARMWPEMERHGLVTPTGGDIRPDAPVRDDEDIENWKQSARRDERAGLKYRKLTVYIASQYGDKLIELQHLKPTDERYLQTVFMCAVTLVHEVGHLLYHSRLSHRPWLGEPLIKGEAMAELGTSLVGWLFNGWIPENISLGTVTRDDDSFSHGCCWYKQRRAPRAYPQYNTLHSMPKSHIQRILDQDEWDKYEDDISTLSTNARKHILSPRTPFVEGETARLAWKARRYRIDRSPSLAPFNGEWDYHDPDWFSYKDQENVVSHPDAKAKEAWNEASDIRSRSGSLWDIPSASQSSEASSAASSRLERGWGAHNNQVTFVADELSGRDFTHGPKPSALPMKSDIFVNNTEQKPQGNTYPSSTSSSLYEWIISSSGSTQAESGTDISLPTSPPTLFPYSSAPKPEIFSVSHSSSSSSEESDMEMDMSSPTSPPMWSVLSQASDTSDTLDSVSFQAARSPSLDSHISSLASPPASSAPQTSDTLDNSNFRVTRSPSLDSDVSNTNIDMPFPTSPPAWPVLSQTPYSVNFLAARSPSLDSDISSVTSPSAWPALPQTSDTSDNVSFRATRSPSLDSEESDISMDIASPTSPPAWPVRSQTSYRSNISDASCGVNFQAARSPSLDSDMSSLTSPPAWPVLWQISDISDTNNFWAARSPSLDSEESGDTDMVDLPFSPPSSLPSEGMDDCNGYTESTSLTSPTRSVERGISVTLCPTESEDLTADALVLLSSGSFLTSPPPAALSTHIMAGAEDEVSGTKTCPAIQRDVDREHPLSIPGGKVASFIFITESEDLLSHTWLNLEQSPAIQGDDVDGEHSLSILGGKPASFISIAESEDLLSHAWLNLEQSPAIQGDGADGEHPLSIPGEKPASFISITESEDLLSYAWLNLEKTSLAASSPWLTCHVYGTELLKPATMHETRDIGHARQNSNRLPALVKNCVVDPRDTTDAQCKRPDGVSEKAELVKPAAVPRVVVVVVASRRRSRRLLGEAPEMPEGVPWPKRRRTKK